MNLQHGLLENLMGNISSAFWLGNEKNSS